MIVTRLVVPDHFRDDEVAKSAMDTKGCIVYVALKGDYYTIEVLEQVDERLRKVIGHVASFELRPEQR